MCEFLWRSRIIKAPRGSTFAPSRRETRRDETKRETYLLLPTRVPLAPAPAAVRVNCSLRSSMPLEGGGSAREEGGKDEGEAATAAVGSASDPVGPQSFILQNLERKSDSAGTTSSGLIIDSRSVRDRAAGPVRS